MKSLKKLLILSSVFFILLLSPQPLVSNAHTYEDTFTQFNNDETYMGETDVEINSMKTVIRILAKLLISVARNISIPNTEGRVTQYPDGDIYVQHPSFKFTQSEDKLRKEVYAYGGTTLRTFAKRDQLFGGGRISIEIQNSSYKKVAGGSYRDQESFDYNVSGSQDNGRTYYIQYGTPYSETWSLRMYYLKPSHCAPSCIIAGDPVHLDDNNVVINDRIYVKQSKKTAYVSNFQGYKERFTMDELFSELYDESMEELTNQTKSLLPGDEVIVEDNIVEVNYISDGDYTIFKFNSTYSNYGSHNILFKGDLTEDYGAGDTLKIKFNMVQTAEIDGEAFIDFDYNVLFEKTNEVPKIDNFVVN